MVRTMKAKYRDAVPLINWKVVINDYALLVQETQPKSV